MMKTCSHLASLALCLAPAAALQGVSESTAAAEADLALRAERVHLGDGTVLEKAVVLIGGGRITAVGADVAVPEGVHLVEHPGHLTAGLIALRDRAGTGEELSDPTRAVLAEAELRHAHAPGHRELAALLREGVTAVLLGADPSALVGGTTAVVKSAGQRVLRPRAYLCVSLTTQALQPNRYPTSYAGALDELGALIDGGRGTFAAVKAKNLPLLIEVDERHEVLRALTFLEDRGLTGVLCGAARAGELAESLARAEVAVVLPAFRLGETRHVTRSALALAEAGVPFGFALDSPLNHPSALRLAAAACLRAGLDRETAWAALTSQAAQLARVADRVGRIASGLDADLVLWSGPPLDLGSRVLACYVDGERVFELPPDELDDDDEEEDDEDPGDTPPPTPEIEENENGGDF